MVKESKQQIECFNCKQLFPLETMISKELIRPPVAELILKRLPDWTPGKMLCPDCLHLFRSEYVEDALEDEKGELSRLDREVLQSLKEQETVTENLNLAFEKDLTTDQYITDQVAAFGGSWIFIIFFFVVLVLWMAVNSTFFLASPFDPYPFILLNLVLSCLAALQAPIIMMSQNRQVAKDRMDAEHDYEVNLKAEMEIVGLHAKLDELRERRWTELIAIQEAQIATLERIE